MWQTLRPDLLRPDLIVSAVLGGLIAFAIRAIFEVIDARRRRSKTRVEITLVLSSYYYEYRSELEALLLQRRKDSPQHWWPALTKLQGRMIEFQMKLWESFSDRRIRAGVARLIHRLQKTQELFCAESMPDIATGKMALGWTDEGYEELVRLVADKAKVPWRDTARLIFVRLGKITPNDFRQLSFEDHPPPWEFGIIFEKGPDRVSAEEKQKAYEKLGKKFGHLRCKVHGRPIHITIGIDRTPGVCACCEEFGQQMGRLLIGGA